MMYSYEVARQSQCEAWPAWAGRQTEHIKEVAVPVSPQALRYGNGARLTLRLYDMVHA